MARYKIKQERPSRAREVAAECKTAADFRPLQVPGIYHVTVTDRGRLVLPVEIRKRLKIRAGDRVAVAIEEDGTIEIETLDVAIRKMRGMFKHLAPKDHFASDDIIAERRREARMDDQRAREWAARHRGKRKP
jgi:AbrB family looped-hinge helix DNA binding protein